MGDHYYTKDPQSASDIRKLEVMLRQQKLSFFSDSGVFSKGKVDFGTQLLIESIDCLPVNAQILDMGCGYGPVGLTLAKEAPQRHVTLVDNNQRAVELTKRNAELNGIHNVTIKHSYLFDALGQTSFQAILSNPPIRAGKEVVYSLLEQSFHHLSQRGEMWIVIQKKQGAESAFNKLQTIFPQVQEMAKKKGYRIIRAKKDSE